MERLPAQGRDDSQSGYGGRALLLDQAPVDVGLGQIGKHDHLTRLARRFWDAVLIAVQAAATSVTMATISQIMSLTMPYTAYAISLIRAKIAKNMGSLPLVCPVGRAGQPLG